MSTLKIAFAAVAALGLLTGAAYAKTAVTAKLASPQAQAVQVVATNPATDTSVWSCAGDSCQAQLTGAASTRVCRALARKVGPIVAFGALSAEELARCNNGIGGAQNAALITQR